MSDRSAQARRQKRDPRTKQFVDEHKPRASTASSVEVDLSSVNQSGKPRGKRKLTVTTAGIRHSFQQDRSGVWTSDCSPEVFANRRLLSQFKAGTIGENIEPLEDPEERIKTMLWGLNTGLLKPEHVPPINRLRPASWTTKKMRDIIDEELAASMLLWHVSLRTRDGVQPSEKNMAHFHLTRRLPHRANHAYWMTGSNLRFRELERGAKWFDPKKHFSKEQHKLILETIVASALMPKEPPSLGSLEHVTQQDHILASCWYQWACLDGHGKERLPEYLKLFDASYIVPTWRNEFGRISTGCWPNGVRGGEPLLKPERETAYWKNRNSTIGAMTFPSISRSEKILFRALAPLARERAFTHVTTAVGTCGAYPCDCASWTWEEASDTMYESLVMCLYNNRDISDPTMDFSTPDGTRTIGRYFPTPAAMLTTADPNKPGFWRLLAGFHRAIALWDLGHDTDFVGGAPLPRTRPGFLDDELPSLLNKLSWHQPTSDEELLHISEQVGRRFLKPETIETMKRNAELLPESINRRLPLT